MFRVNKIDCKECSFPKNYTIHSKERVLLSRIYKVDELALFLMSSSLLHQGICPGNRLRIVPGCYDDGSGFVDVVRSQNRRETNLTTKKVSVIPLFLFAFIFIVYNFIL